MKFSSPSSSPSNSCIDVGLRNSNGATAGCVSGFLRRFLCGNLSSRPSNHIAEADGEDTTTCQAVEERIKPSPSIVARLMGLESMPELGSIPLARNPEAIGRSRSVNSINNWLEFDPAQRLHRRVRTSVSFREIPTFLREENQDFILLCFGSDGREKPVVSGSKELNSDLSFGEAKKKSQESSRRKAKEKRKEGRAEKKDQASDWRPSRRKITPEMTIESNSVVSVEREIYNKPCSKLQMENSSKPASKRREIAGIMKLTKKKKAASFEKSVESNCSSSENSSPVSVLDSPFDTDKGFLNDSENSIASSDDLMEKNPVSSRRKLSLVAANFDCLSSHISQNSISNGKEQKPKNNVDGERRKKRSNSLYCSDVWREICLVAGDDMMRLSWVSVSISKMEDVEEIGVGFEEQILGFLLHETIEELAGH